MPNPAARAPSLKVLVVSQYFWPENFRINDVVTSLIEKGCLVTVLTGQPNYPDGEVYPGYKATGIGSQQHASGAEIVRVPLAPRGTKSGVRLGINYLSFVVSAVLFAPWLLRGKKFDVVFVYAISPILQAIPAILLRRIKGAALVVWVQDQWPQSLEVTGFVRNRHVLNAVGRLTRWIYSHCDRLLVQSEAFLTPVRNMAGQVPVAFHPNPGDRVSAKSVPSATLPAGFCVVIAGNMGNAQSPETVIQMAAALRDLTDLRIVLIGGGSRLNWLLDEAGRLELENIEYLGRFPSDAMLPILCQASALLLTLGKGEILSQTVPSKLATYLAAGRPIIGSLDGEGARIILESGAGLTSPSEESDGLAKIVRDIYSMPVDERDRMGASGRRYFVQNLDPDHLADRLVDQFDTAIKEAGFKKERTK